MTYIYTQKKRDDPNICKKNTNQPFSVLLTVQER